MANPSEVARIAADQKVTDLVMARAQELRDAAQAEYDALVARQQTLVQEQIARLTDIDERSLAAAAVHANATAAHAETAKVLGAAQADVDRVNTERRDTTSSHIDEVRDIAERIGPRSAQLVVDYWLARATAEIAGGDA